MFSRPLRSAYLYTEVGGQLWDLAIGGCIFPSDSSEQWPSGQKRISQMIGDEKRLWSEGAGTWVLILGLWFACNMNLGHHLFIKYCFRTIFVGLSEKQLSRWLETCWRDSGRGKAFMGHRTDPCEGETEGSRVRLQCLVRQFQPGQGKFSSPRAPSKGVPCPAGTGLY